jgi:hypothetical protein
MASRRPAAADALLVSPHGCPFGDRSPDLCGITVKSQLLAEERHRVSPEPALEQNLVAIEIDETGVSGQRASPGIGNPSLDQSVRVGPQRLAYGDDRSQDAAILKYLREVPGHGYAERTLYLVACVKLANDHFRAVGFGEAKVRRDQ